MSPLITDRLQRSKNIESFQHGIQRWRGRAAAKSRRSAIHASSPTRGRNQIGILACATAVSHPLPEGKSMTVRIPVVEILIKYLTSGRCSGEPCLLLDHSSRDSHSHDMVRDVAN